MLSATSSRRAIAAAAERIGLIATASTTRFEPYGPARLFASLDHRIRRRHP